MQFWWLNQLENIRL